MTNITTQTGSTTRRPRRPSKPRTRRGEVASTARRELPEASRAPHQEPGSTPRARVTGISSANRRVSQTRHDEQTVRDIGGQLQNMASGQAPPNGMLADVTEQAASSGTAWPEAEPSSFRRGHLRCEAVSTVAGPGIFIAGALGAGLLTSRLVRSMDGEHGDPGRETRGSTPAAGLVRRSLGPETGLGSGNGQPVAGSPISAGAASHERATGIRKLSDPDPSIRRRSSEMANVGTAGNGAEDDGSRSARRRDRADRVGQVPGGCAVELRLSAPWYRRNSNWPKPGSKTRCHAPARVRARSPAAARRPTWPSCCCRSRRQ